jgi:threonine/homoserine/homoserine lactone efflux protein
VSATAIDSGYLEFVGFTFVLVATPGSTTAVVVRNALEGGRRAGYLTAAGAALANSVIAIGCGVGLSMLVAVWPGSLDAIRIGGALFLAWLGCGSLFRAWTRPDGGIRLPVDPGDGPPRSHAAAYFGDGLAINLLSPVIISYYLSVVPSYVPAGAPRWYYPGLAATHVTLAWLCHALWATALDFMRRRFAHPARRRLLQAAIGIALITLAARILLQG